MFIMGSVATTVDGFTSEKSPRRLMLSSQDDLREVYRLRAACDAVLVGAATVRADDPRLVTTHPAHAERRRRLGLAPDPIKVTLTRTGNLNPAAKFFTHGAGPKLVFCPMATRPALHSRLGSAAEVIGVDDDFTPARMVAELNRRGVRALLVEGGQETLRQFFVAGLIDRLRWAVAPRVLGERGDRRFLGGGARVLHPAATERFGDTTVLHFDCAPDAPAAETKEPAADHLARAVTLARFCPPTTRAFSVGAVLVAPDGRVLATGFSRERGPKWHAEEVALAKARERGATVTGATMYSTMEPCGRRLSGSTCCADLIRDAGVADVVYAIAEPPIFVMPEGLTKLRGAGIGLRQDQRFEDEVLRQNEV